MRRLTKIEEVRTGNVILIVGYDSFNFASGDADGWFTEIFSVAAETITEPGDVEQPDRKLVKAEGDPLTNARGYQPLYMESDAFVLGYDGGAHACANRGVQVFLLQTSRMSDHADDPNGEAIDMLIGQSWGQWDDGSASQTLESGAN